MSQFPSTVGVAQERQWGGKRVGAGRKVSPDVKVTLRLPREVWTRLQELAQTQGKPPEEIAAQWLQDRSSEAADSA